MNLRRFVLPTALAYAEMHLFERTYMSIHIEMKYVHMYSYE